MMDLVMDDRVKYWLDLAEEDLSVARILINNKLLHAASSAIKS